MKPLQVAKMIAERANEHRLWPISLRKGDDCCAAHNTPELEDLLGKGARITHENKCQVRVPYSLASTMDSLAVMLLRHSEGVDEDDENRMQDYGLSFEYVEPGTFGDEGYWRFLMSYGGPSDEFRFFISPGGRVPYRVEYWFLDWFDGACVDCKELTDDDAVEGERLGDATTIQYLWDYFEPVWDNYEYGRQD